MTPYGDKHLSMQGDAVIELFDLPALQRMTSVGTWPEVDRVVNDRGHGISVMTKGGERCPLFVDLGSVLAVWSGLGAELRPKDARLLGEALVEWAAKKDA